ncbi:MAG: glycosyltransferase family 2 protein [Candidatus Omnitrophica bacterium]|nr:glycosyltransferase family 2 protein [Candidatus Omnitrophota bacterium]
MTTLSIIVPVFFNEESLPLLYEKLEQVSRQMNNVCFEYVFVDDGSKDNSYKVLLDISKSDKRVKIVKLSRNFGSFVACFAGLTYAKGDCALIMAADLQDPPELIPELFSKWQQGSEVVFAVKQKREESSMNIFFSSIFHRIFRLIALGNAPKHGFDFVLIGRKVIDVLVKSGEKNSSIMGQIIWAGFKTDQISYTKKARLHGKSRWKFWTKIKYFIDSIMAFSYFPIRMASFLGIGIALIGFIFAVYAVYRRIFFGVNVPGFTLLLVVILLTSGAQMILLGIIGEYIWRALDEARKRPIFIVDELINND